MPFELEKLRVDEHHQVFGLAADGQIDDEDSEGDADLRGCQTDAGRRIHGLDHVVDELLDVAGQLADVLRARVQRGLAKLQNRPNHPPSLLRAQLRRGEAAGR